MGAVPRPERVRRRRRDRLPGRLLPDQPAWSGRRRCPSRQSSPVVVGSLLYVTATEGDRLLTIAFDAAAGRRAVAPVDPPPAHRRTCTSPTTRPRRRPPPTSTASSSSSRDFGLAAYGPDGTDRWRDPLGPFMNFYGMAGSPIIAGDALILVCDQLRGRLCCRWIAGPDGSAGAARVRRHGVVGDADGVSRRAAAPAQLIVLGSSRLDGYTLATGAPRWWMPLSSRGALGTRSRAATR